MQNLEKIAEKMLRQCNANCLPAGYQTDISIDVWTILNSKAKKFVWLIRENGSSLLPLRQGANPVSIEYYIHEPKVRVFLIEWQSCAVVEISLSNAIELSNLPPLLNKESTTDATFDRVWEVLEEGCRCAFWGILPPIRNPMAYTYPGWHKYFLEQEHAPMSEFMCSALKLLQKTKTAA